MPSLPELQNDFVAVVLRRAEPAALERHLQPRGDVARRIGVYRANARENFAAALEAAYPVLLGQLGAEDFRRMAWSYQRRHPSPAGNLFESGRALPAFLDEVLAGTADAWLAQLARLEWAVQEAMTAADAEQRFDPAAIAAVAPGEQARLRPRLHPSVRLLSLVFPCFEAWRAHQAGARAAAPAEADPELLLVRRTAAGIELQKLTAAELRCLAELARGGTLGAAAEAFGTDAPAADFARRLAGWVASGIVVAVAGPTEAGA